MWDAFSYFIWQTFSLCVAVPSPPRANGHSLPPVCPQGEGTATCRLANFPQIWCTKSCTMNSSWEWYMYLCMYYSVLFFMSCSQEGLFLVLTPCQKHSTQGPVIWSRVPETTLPQRQVYWTFIYIHTYFIWCLIHRTSTLFQINLQFDNFLTLTDGYYLSYFIAIVYVLCN